MKARFELIRFHCAGADLLQHCVYRTLETVDDKLRMAGRYGNVILFSLLFSVIAAKTQIY